MTDAKNPKRRITKEHRIKSVFIPPIGHTRVNGNHKEMGK